MIFKVTFVDGSFETVHASSPGEAKRLAVQHFRSRVFVRVEPAGLTDMANVRPQPVRKPPQSQSN